MTRRLLLAWSVLWPMLFLGCAVRSQLHPYVVSAPKPQRPKAELRVSPQIAFTPANVLIHLELKGGEDTEALYCPEIEWNYGDETRSVRESDCEPWKPGTVLERRVSMWHCYRGPGEFSIVVTLSKAHRKIAVATGHASVRWSPQGGRC